MPPKVVLPSAAPDPAADEPVRPIALASGQRCPDCATGPGEPGGQYAGVRASPPDPPPPEHGTGQGVTRLLCAVKAACRKSATMESLRSGRDRAVATRGLGRVEGLVGPLEQLTGALLEVPGGHPNGAGDLGCDGLQPLGDAPYFRPAT
jgi:hypothetical protein